VKREKLFTKKKKMLKRITRFGDVTFG